MRKPRWNVDNIVDRCEELGIEFLDKAYKHDIKGNFRCACGNVFNRLFSNVNKGQTLCSECVKTRDYERREKFLKKQFIDFKTYVEEESNSNCEVLSTHEDYLSNKSNIEIRCSCGEIFYPTANNFKRGHQSCFSCGSKRAGEARRVSKEHVFEMIMSDGYKPLKYWYDTEHRVLVSCKERDHKPYITTYSNFYSGHRCPSCNISKGEESVANFLDEKGFNYMREYTFDDLLGRNNQGLRFDFCVKSESGDIIMLIEYDGEQHFLPKFGDEEFIRTQMNDKRKDDYCNRQNIHLLRIPYTKFNDIDSILSETLNV